MSDEGLVKRLRNTTIAIQPVFPTLRHEAADAIERLTRERDEAFQKYVDANEARIDAEAKVAKLREVLLPFADIGEWSEDFFDASMASVDVALGDLRRARAVLQETETKGE